METVKIAISKIKLNPSNPRVIKDDKFKKLVKSIKEFPEMLKIRPIVVNEDMIVLGGNQRLKACRDAGLKEVYIINADELTPEQQQEFIIKDNSGFGEWDFEMLSLDFDPIDLDEWGVDLPEGFGEIEEDVSAEEDDYDIPDEIETDIKYGDIYQIGEHRLMCGDSTKKEDVEKLMDGELAELLFTSPPYSDMREYNGGKDLSVNNLVKFIEVFYKYCEYQIINLGIQRKEHNIVQYWDEYISKAKESGYLFLSWNIWHKANGAGSVGNQTAFFPIEHEWLFVFGKKFKDINRTIERKTKIEKRKTRTHRQKDGSMIRDGVGKQEELKEMGSVFYSNTELGEIRGLHPATFPIELPAEHIKAITDVNDIVTEPFLGSGSTMVACHQLKRRCYGLELDPKYCQVIIDRMLKLDPDLEVKKL